MEVLDSEKKNSNLLGILGLFFTRLSPTFQFYLTKILNLRMLCSNRGKVSTRVEGMYDMTLVQTAFFTQQEHLPARLRKAWAQNVQD